MQTRNTVQQRIVSDQLRQLDNHPTVDEVYEAVRTQRPSISKATVYRVLNKMAHAGDAFRVLGAGGAERFDHRTDPHYHVVCTVCGRVDDIEMPPSLDGLDSEVALDASGYIITGHSLLFHGVCPSCQKAQEKER
jgi:Fe2+ or Zn2+ uptake regulation protein